MAGLMSLLGLGDSSACKELADKFEALSRSEAVVEYDISGTVLHANDNFLNLMGYRLDEVIGKDHSMFVCAAERVTSDYQNLWAGLARGVHSTAESKTVSKSGKDVWLQGSFNPLMDKTGKPYKVVQYGTDITSYKSDSHLANALELCQANVMLADNDNNIVYMNKTVTTMLRDNQKTLQTALPNFSVNKVIGTNVDDFHANPDHQRKMLKELSDPYDTNIEVAGLTFGLIATPWTDSDGERIGTLVEWKDKTEEVARAKEERKIAQANSRIKGALDVCKTSVMMADADMNIIYMNSSVDKMLRNRATELKAILPNFNVDKLMGFNVDGFHVDPSKQRKMLAELDGTYETDLPLGGLTFGLTATTIRDDDGELLGTVVEWIDKTEALALEAKEREIAQANSRIKGALDVCNTSVMMADADMNIIYMNDSVKKMMSNRSKELKEVLPNFNADKLLGFNVDNFHVDPSKQRKMLADLTDTFETDLPLGGLTFGLTANTIRDDDGALLGTVVEWEDKTERLAEEARELEAAQTNARIKAALDVCNTAVMMADADMNIIYMNGSVETMMSDASAELKAVLPQFDASKLMGFNVDNFHVDPSKQRKMLADLTGTFKTNLPIGGLTFGLIATTIRDDDGTLLGTVVEWENKTASLALAVKEREIAQANSRIKGALDVCNTSVMMADADMNIIYMNESVKKMMSNRSKELKAVLPQFDANKLMGFNVDNFHVDPSKQRKMLADLTGTFETDLPLGGLTFGLTANTIRDDDGELLGTVVEWEDKTERLAAELKEREAAQSNARIKTALDVCNTAVMMADADMNIIYMNDSVQTMMSDASAELKTVLPQFDASKLMGFNVDNFHVDPSKQRKMLADLTGTFSTNLPIGGLTFGLIATTIRDDDGTLLGTVVEWENKTESLALAAKELELSQANARIKTALDVCNTAVMMADADMNIIYMNESVTEMMSNRSKELKGVLPNFNADKLMGFNVDNFHVDPSKQRGMLANLTGTFETNLPLAGLTFGLIATTIRDDDGTLLGTVVEWEDKTERLAEEAKELEIAQANARIKTALDVCNTAVMMADADMNIIYMNESVTQMMKNRSKELKEVLPNFNADKLMGFNVDGFHVDPSKQRGMLANLTGTFETSLPLAGLTFGLIATTIRDDDGTLLGTVVEWEDKTERLATEAKEQAIAQTNAQIKTALDVCKTSVMMADADMNIIYMNDSVQNMLRNRQVELQSVLPNFNAEKLMGFNVDNFHKTPSHQRNLLKNLTTTFATDLPLAGLTFGLTATPIRDDEGEWLGTVVEWEDKTERLALEREEQKIAEENARVKQALDNVTANVMIADNDCNIIYLNKAVLTMMRTAESDIKKDLPHFDASKLQGTNIDIFHKNPSYQRNLLGDLKGTYNGKAEAGGRTFTVIANPVYKDGERAGTVVEWNDRTAELGIEKEIDQMVEAAATGDFSINITTEGKEGFFLNLGNGLNSLVSTVEVALNDIIRMLGAMSQGDLSERITRDYEGSFGQMKMDANTTVDKLTEVISAIRGAATSIETSSNEVAQGNASLSQRTEEQASSLEETAASMEEMTSTVKQSADNAQKANEMAAGAQSLAREGGLVVEKAVIAMEEINKSSKQISDIISVIDEIAFQTNLLALNAAVEAARAGEQGRGFAVVAGEVRNLAQRSAGAAKEIKDLIRDSVDKVADGTSLVNRSGEVLTEIVDSVDKVNITMEEIAAAAKEQSSGIEQVNKAITQMDEMTQQNAALVEEASAAGQAMSDQARSMNRVVEFFSHEGAPGGGGGAAPAAPAPAPAKRVKAKRAAQGGQASGGDDWEEF